LVPSVKSVADDDDVAWGKCETEGFMPHAGAKRKRGILPFCPACASLPYTAGLRPAANLEQGLSSQSRFGPICLLACSPSAGDALSLSRVILGFGLNDSVARYEKVIWQYLKQDAILMRDIVNENVWQLSASARCRSFFYSCRGRERIKYELLRGKVQRKSKMICVENVNRTDITGKIGYDCSVQTISDCPLRPAQI
jgi:hypothetical protein